MGQLLPKGLAFLRNVELNRCTTAVYMRGRLCEPV
jgi:hypothetical protein